MSTTDYEPIDGAHITIIPSPGQGYVFIAIQGTKLLELANKAHSLYLQQSSGEKARLLRTVQSNCTWDGLNPRPI